MMNVNTIANRITRPTPDGETLEDLIILKLNRREKTKILNAYAQTISSQRRSRSLIAIVLNAALDLINSPKDDLLGISLAQLAQHSGTTRSGIYRYFSDVSSIIYHALKELLDAGMTSEQFTRRELCIMAYYGLVPLESLIPSEVELEEEMTQPVKAKEERAAA